MRGTPGQGRLGDQVRSDLARRGPRVGSSHHQVPGAVRPHQPSFAPTVHPVSACRRGTCAAPGTSSRDHPGHAKPSRGPHRPGRAHQRCGPSHGTVTGMAPPSSVSVLLRSRVASQARYSQNPRRCVKDPSSYQNGLAYPSHSSLPNVNSRRDIRHFCA